MMRHSETESYQEWAERTRIYELGHALKALAQGHSLEKILDSMSLRIQDKMLHPVYKILKQLT